MISAKPRSTSPRNAPTATATHMTMMLRRSVSSLEGHVTLRSSPTTSPIMRTLNARRATSPPTLRVTPGSLATTISPHGAAHADGTAGRTSSAPSAEGRFAGSCWSGTSALGRSCSQALREFWLLPDGPFCCITLTPTLSRQGRGGCWLASLLSRERGAVGWRLALWLVENLRDDA